MLPNAIRRALFGYDIFISYSRKDSIDYAYRLAEHFIQQGYECFIDQLSSITPGKAIPKHILGAIKSSKSMIVIGSAGSRKSYPIAKETETFLKYRKSKPIIPIDVGGAIKEAIWYSQIEGLAFVNEEPDNLAGGKPSDEVIKRIQNSLTFTKRSKRLRRIAFVVLLITLIITGIAFWLLDIANNAIDEKVKVEKQVKDAKIGLKIANSAKDKAIKEKKDAQDTNNKLSLINEQLKNDSIQLANKNAELEKQSNMLQYRVAAQKQLEKDPVIAYRLAQEAYRLSPDAENRKLIMASVSSIDMYYKYKFDFSGYLFEDFKEPYLLLYKYDTNFIFLTKRYKIINIYTNKSIQLNTKSYLAKIISDSYSSRLITFEQVSDKTEYRLYDIESGSMIGESIFGSIDKYKFYNNKIRIWLYNKTDFMDWNLISNEKKYTKIEESDTLKSYISLNKIPLEINSDGESVYKYKESLLFINSNGHVIRNFITATDTFEDAYEANLSNDEKYLAYIYQDSTSKLGLWNIEGKEFNWLKQDDYSVKTYKWSNGKHIIAIAYLNEYDNNSIITIFDPSNPEILQKEVFRGSSLIKDIQFLPGDNEIACCDLEGNITVIQISTGERIFKCFHENAKGFYCTKDTLYSISNTNIINWYLKQSPSKHWFLRANKIKTYDPQYIAIDPSGNWCSVPFTNKDTNGVEIMHLTNGSKYELIINDMILYNEFKRDGKCLILLTVKQKIIWDTEFQKESIQNLTFNEICSFIDTIHKWEKESPMKSEDPDYYDNIYRKVEGWKNIQFVPSIWGESKSYFKWAIFVSYKNEIRSYLDEYDCSIQFIPTDIKMLMSIYDPILWKPSRKELEELKSNY